MSTPVYFGKYKAIVTKIYDPEERTRIKVKCPMVLGEDESNWCEPCLPCAFDYGGDFYLPKIGETVWIEFERGNPNKPIWVGNWHSQVKSPVMKARNAVDNSSAPPLEYIDAHDKVRIIHDFDVWIVIHKDYLRIYRKDTEIYTSDEQIYIERTGGKMKFHSEDNRTHLTRGDSTLSMTDDDTQLNKEGSTIKLEKDTITIKTDNLIISTKDINIKSDYLTEIINNNITETALNGNILNSAPNGFVTDKDKIATYH